MKKLIPIFLVLIAVCFFTACNNDGEITAEETTVIEETTTQKAIENKLTLGYFEKKGFNPYTTKSTANAALLTLVYDGLFVNDKGYSVTPAIASSSTNEGTQITVKLGDDIYFSDGSPISAYDVLYSFSLAKKSSAYASSLSNFVSAKPDGTSIIFTLERSDIYGESVLTFPIVKEDTGDNDIPVGSGRYTLKKKDGEYILTANNSNTRREELNIEKIYLTSLSVGETELYSLQSGDLSYFYDDLSDGEYTKITANMYKTATNNLVFLSFNNESELIQDTDVKNAVCSSIDVSSALTSALGNMYRLPCTVFNPDWYVLEDESESTLLYDVQKANSLLEKSGYIYAYSTNTTRSKNFEYIELSFLYCNDTQVKEKMAKEIIKSLENVGIKVNVQALPYEDYIKALKSGSYDLYLGEVRLSANMNLDCFFSENGSVSYGIDSDCVTAKAYYDFAGGLVDAKTFIQVFQSEMPFFPLCYRDSMSYYSRELSFDGNFNEYEPFKDIYSWEV